MEGNTIITNWMKLLGKRRVDSFSYFVLLWIVSNLNRAVRKPIKGRVCMVLWMLYVVIQVQQQLVFL